MVQSCYSIEKHRDRWSVSVFGTKVLVCDSRKMALQAVRQATQALCLNRQGNNSGRERAAPRCSRRAHAKTPCKAQGRAPRGRQRDLPMRF